MAFIFWVLNILGKTYLYELDAFIAFKHLPQDKALVLDQENKVTITVQGTGWNFIRSKLQLLNDTLRIDLRKYQDKDEIDLSKNILDFELQWDDRLKIVQLYPSKIIFNVEQKRIKKIPVHLNMALNLAPTYDVISEVKFSPDSVFVSGSKVEIDKLKFVETLPLVTDMLDKPTTYITQIDYKKYNNIIFSTSSVKVEIPVEQFTENTVNVPIINRETLLNHELVTFPSKCNITYRVALSKYNEVNAQSFKVMAERSPNLVNQLSLKLKVQPSHVKFVRIYPQTVNYLWIKKVL